MYHEKEVDKWLKVCCRGEGLKCCERHLDDNGYVDPCDAFSICRRLCKVYYPGEFSPRWEWKDKIYVNNVYDPNSKENKCYQ